ncbi:MAG: cytochrome family protein [Xanthobacteraceae bacterium]|nr:cytochrome family protein [Xanthobacteraceae bacterium]
MNSASRFLSAVSIATIVALGIAVWTNAKASEHESAHATSPANYLPSVSDLMIATIQPRHVKLWVAGQHHNWKLAAYEMETLTGAFRRLIQAHPEEDGVALKDIVDSVTQQPFADLDQAIHAKDETRFNKAYGDLTSGCNSCHQALNHGEVVIRTPKDSAFPNQEFAPTEP